MDTMFDTLLQLPLFQGLTEEDFTHIVGKVKLHFNKHKAGETIAQAGERCDRLIFLLKGEMAACTAPAHGVYTFTECVPAPSLVEPQSLFGMNTTFVRTYTARTEVHTVSIGKSFMLSELSKYEIFRLNYINIITNRAQTLHAHLWADMADTLEGRIRQFVLSHSERPSGEKILKIKMEDLARFVNDTRLNVSRTLNMMQSNGLVELHRGEVFIYDSALL